MRLERVAGADGVLKLYPTIDLDDAALRPMLTGRIIICEIADDTPWYGASQALESCGFIEEGRVPDFVRDGVSLRILVWRAS